MFQKEEITFTWASQVAQRLKRLPGMQETWVQSLSREDPLEKEVAPHSSTLAWRSPWREEPGRLQSMGSQRVGHDFTFTFTFFHFGHRTVQKSSKVPSWDYKLLSLGGT